MSEELIQFIVIGAGRWANTYKKSISKLNLTEAKSLSSKLTNCEWADGKGINDFNEGDKIVISATDPFIQNKFVKLINKSSLPLILEKPLCYDIETYDWLRKSIHNRPNRTLVGFYNLLNPNFRALRSNLIRNWDKVKKLTINDGSNGPIRKSLSPYFDWGPHVFSIIQGFPNGAKFRCEIFEEKSETQCNYTLSGYLGKTKIKALFGNNFTMKKRSILVEYTDGSRYLFDFGMKSTRELREMDRLLMYSKNYFFKEKYKSCKFFSPFDCNDSFLLQNAYFTQLYGTKFL